MTIVGGNVQLIYFVFIIETTVSIFWYRSTFWSSLIWHRYEFGGNNFNLEIWFFCRYSKFQIGNYWSISLFDLYTEIKQSTCGTTIVKSRLSPLNLRCLWLECRWLRRNSRSNMNVSITSIRYQRYIDSKCLWLKMLMTNVHFTWWKSSLFIKLRVFEITLKVRTGNLDTGSKFCIFSMIQILLC